MSNPEIVFSLLEESDIDPINDFYNRTYGSDRTREKFLWEFMYAPAGKAIYIVAKDLSKNLIVGTQCAIPIYLQDEKGMQILTAKSEDTLVHPDYRGQKIFDRMYEELFEACRKVGIQYIWGFTSALKPFRKMGFETPFEHTQALFVKRAKAAGNYISMLNPNNGGLEKLKISLLTQWSKIKSVRNFHYKKHLIIDCKLIVKKMGEIEELNTLLQNALQDTNCFFISEDEKYLNWRLNENPYSKNVIDFTFTENQKPIASFIFNYDKNCVWYLVQAIWSGKLKSEKEIALFKKAIRELCKHEKVAMIRTWNFSHNTVNAKEIRLLESSGFVHLNRGISFVWKDISTGTKLYPKNFFLSRMATQGIM